MLQIMIQEKGPFNIALDEFAGSSFITNSAAEALNLEATEKQEPFCINGFGNHYTDIIDEYVVITFQNSVNVEFN